MVKAETSPFSSMLTATLIILFVSICPSPLKHQDQQESVQSTQPQNKCLLSSITQGVLSFLITLNSPCKPNLHKISTWDEPALELEMVGILFSVEILQFPKRRIVFDSKILRYNENLWHPRLSHYNGNLL